jgi:hypothetical protein
MQYREQPEHGLVGVRAGIGTPSKEQGPLLDDRECAATKSSIPLGHHTPRRVDEHHPVAAREPEELAQHSQTSWPIVRLPGQESLDICHIHQRPILFAALRIKEASQITHDPQRSLDGSVSAWAGASTSGAFAGMQHEITEI